MNALHPQAAIVVIGRNEGQRLRRCLQSISITTAPALYVDSGSTDGSTLLATSFGLDVVHLDPPHTAAAARNAGLARLRRLHPALHLVQFLDGDCELQPLWIERAAAWLGDHPSHAAVCGACREREPQASIYHWLCDVEWRMSLGPVPACGGNAMMRIEALEEVGGFDPAFIAGEESDLCCRLRRRGWSIHCLGADMVVHDAAIASFAQWRRRTVRAGHAYAQCSWRHGGPPLFWWLRATLSNWFWGLVLPSLTAALAIAVGWKALILPGLYVALLARIFCRRFIAGDTVHRAIAYALFCTLAKFPLVLGQLRFHLRSVLAQPPLNIEHKPAPVSSCP